MDANNIGATEQGQKELFLSVAHGMNDMLLQLNLLSEASVRRAGADQKLHWEMIQTVTQAALSMVEGYATSLRVSSGTAELSCKPFSLQALLRQTSELLQPYAEQLHVQLELDLPTQMAPVLSDPVLIRSALLNLGQVFLLAQAETDQVTSVRLTAHNTRYGVVAGLYGAGFELTKDSLRRARQFRGTLGQPFSELTAGSAGGVFVADALLDLLSARLRVARFRNNAGLAVTLPICQQLQLV